MIIKTKKPLQIGRLFVCRGPDSNWGPTHFQCVALPTELPRQGGRYYAEFCPEVKRRFGPLWRSLPLLRAIFPVYFPVVPDVPFDRASTRAANRGCCSLRASKGAL